MPFRHHALRGTVVFRAAFHAAQREATIPALSVYSRVSLGGAGRFHARPATALRAREQWQRLKEKLDDWKTNVKGLLQVVPKARQEHANTGQQPLALGA